jgi:amino-acid N-acetyltransferase
MFTLRAAEKEDQRAIRTLVISAGLNPLGLDWRRFIIATQRDGVVGCGQVKPHRDGSCELASIVVASRWRGRGIARAVIRRLMAEAGSPLWLMCRSGLMSFYEPFGFREVRSLADLPATFRWIGWLSRCLVFILHRDEPIVFMVWRNS